MGVSREDPTCCSQFPAPHSDPQRREAQHWTQEGFADHIKMHRTQYGVFERGNARDVQLSTLERIAAGLGEPVWALIREAEEP